jgi:hypothetical protein
MLLRRSDSRTVGHPLSGNSSSSAGNSSTTSSGPRKYRKTKYEPNLSTVIEAPTPSASSPARSTSGSC